MEKIAQIFSIVAAAATVAAIFVAACVCLVKLIKKAKAANSDGGVKITPEEWKKIGISLLPFGVKILEYISRTEQSLKEKSEEAKKDNSAQDIKKDPTNESIY